MEMEVRQTRWMRVFAPLVWLALLQVLVLTLLASSPVLHECSHADAHESDHHCLSTDFNSGSIDPTVTQLACVPEFRPVVIAELVVACEARRTLPIHLCGSLLEHGPPVRS